MLKRHLAVGLLAALFLLAFLGCKKNSQEKQRAVLKKKSEVMYQIFERSFYDSNGDKIGDFNGIQQKLGYLQQLGVTSIWLTPTVKSAFYHNYFADNFQKVDSTYGTMQDWINLVKAVHQRGMKIYLDMEIQYVTKKQKWYKDSYKNPQSPYSDYLIYNGPDNTKPEPIVYDISTLKAYNGATRKVATVNLYSKDVLHFFDQLFHYWMDPNDDGNFNDGVDGFRIDHMMNNLDNKGILTHLFKKFWCPLITKMKAINPDVIFIAEQAHWNDYGTKYFKRGCIDRVFAFNLKFAIDSFNKQKIADAADSTFSHTPPGHHQIVFIENHDTDRFASTVNQDSGKLRVGAALNLLIGGIPEIYYGQELGMFGKAKHFGNTAGNDIPRREAFEWYKSDSGNGMAIWYKNTGPWWGQTNLIPNDGVSLQEEKGKKESLWNFYQTMIGLHKSSSALSFGEYAEVKNNNDAVFSFIRYTKKKHVLVAVNLSGEPQKASLKMEELPVKWNHRAKVSNLFGKGKLEKHSGRLTLKLSAYGVKVLKW